MSYTINSREKERHLESKNRYDFNLYEQFKNRHEKIRRHMEHLGKKYNIDDFAGKLSEQYKKLKSSIRFSKMGEYLKLIDSWVEVFKNSPSFSPEKLEEFQKDISLLVLALKDALEAANEGLEGWLEISKNGDSIAEAADKADEAVMARSKQEQDALFAEIRQNKNNSKTSLA